MKSFCQHNPLQTSNIRLGYPGTLTRSHSFHLRDQSPRYLNIWNNQSRSYKSLAFTEPHYTVTSNEIKPISGEINEDTLRRAFSNSCNCSETNLKTRLIKNNSTSDRFGILKPSTSSCSKRQTSLLNIHKLNPCTCFHISDVNQKSQPNLLSNTTNTYLNPCACTLKRSPSFRRMQCQPQPVVPQSRYNFGTNSARNSFRANSNKQQLFSNGQINSEIDQEVIQELEECFPSLYQGWLPVCELKNALKVAGLDLAGHEYRELEQELGNYLDGKIPVNTFFAIYMRVKDAKDQTKTFRKENILKERPDLRVYESNNQPFSTATAKHSVSPAEERAFVDWINRMLGADMDLIGHLPINYQIDGQLYERCRDGLLICKLINFAVTNTIDERCINKPPFTRSVFKANENLMLAVNSAESIGCCVVNVGPEDIAKCSRHLVLGLIWQIIRIGLLSVISLSHHAELACLLSPYECLDDLRLLSPEDLLIRWVNYHLERSGITHRMNNFSTDLMDSEIYAALLQQVAPDEHRALMIPASGILAESDMFKRAEMVIENADFLGAGAFIAAEDIALANERGMNRDKLHLAFLANLFNLYPGFESGPVIEIDETLEEKTYRNWMNSMGVAPFVKDLSADLRSGLIFLQLIDVLSPGIVEWTKIVRCFDHKRRLFQMQDNCAYAIEYASQLSLNLVNQSGEDIRTGDRKLTLGLTFQLMRLHTLQMLTKMRGNGWPVDEAEILSWVNDRLLSIGAAPLCSFRDGSISTGVPVLNLINTIKPNSVDKTMVSKDKDANCRLAISIARKIGARVYALPEHLREVNPKMIMTVFACLMVLDFQLNGSA